MTPKFHVGDHVKWKGYVGEIILINPSMPGGPYKVMFDAPDSPDYWYYPEDELELVTPEKKEKKNERLPKRTAN
jgi:hypothetical protein